MTGRESSSLRAGMLFLWLAALGCRADRAEWHATLADPRIQRMVGIWALELQLERNGADTLARPVLGVISLTLNEEGRSAAGFQEPPVFFGTYDIPFGRAGFELSPTSGIPAVVARIRGDSVDLKLAPDSKLTITMTGVLVGDSIVGGWATEYRRAGIEVAGRFVLRRR